MNDLVTTLIASVLGAGGGLVAIITVIMTHSREKKTLRKEDIDDRIAAWQKISDKHEQELAAIKRELEQARMDNRALELYIHELTLAMAKAVPPLEIPPYPILTQ